MSQKQKTNHDRLLKTVFCVLTSAGEISTFFEFGSKNALWQAPVQRGTAQEFSSSLISSILSRATTFGVQLR